MPPTPSSGTIRIARPDWIEFHFRVVRRPRELSAATWQRFREMLHAHGDPAVVKVDAFGLEPEPENHFPATRVNADGVGGILARAVAGPRVETIRLNGQAVGTWFEDRHARYCLLGGIGPDEAMASEPEQARQVFEKAETGLRCCGMTFGNVVRTWFYLRDILSWYGRFNEVRNRFFAERNIFAGVVPASTGVGADNPAGAALVAGLVAVEPKPGGAQVNGLSSPRQGPAWEYGSAFSRAVEIATPACRELHVSGTASIGRDGRSTHPGDADAQVAATMDAVQDILNSRAMNWTHVTHAIAYFKTAAAAWQSYLRQQDLSGLPAILTQGDICRDELLVEIELSATRTGGQDDAHPRAQKGEPPPPPRP